MSRSFPVLQTLWDNIVERPPFLKHLTTRWVHTLIYPLRWFRNLLFASLIMSWLSTRICVWLPKTKHLDSVSVNEQLSYTASFLIMQGRIRSASLDKRLTTFCFLITNSPLHFPSWQQSHSLTSLIYIVSCTFWIDKNLKSTRINISTRHVRTGLGLFQVSEETPNHITMYSSTLWDTLT